MPSIVWMSRWRALQARARAAVPAPLRRLAPASWRSRSTKAWDLNAAERDPLFERYAHTRPQGPLRHHIGVTASPRYAEARNLAAAAAELGGRVTFFDPDDVDWPKQVREAGCDGHLLRVRHGHTADWSLDQARLAYLHLLGTPTWPTPSEAFLYEDKARFTWWLAARGVPHVPTFTFVDLERADAFFETATYPLVVKTRHDSGGHGVERIANRREARAVARVFLEGRFYRRGQRDWREAEHGALIVQPFLPVAAEHRVIRLGDAWFAHGKQLAPGGWRYSGSGHRDLEFPGFEVLDRALTVAERIGLHCGAIDLLTLEDGSWLVGEVQTWYGGVRVMNHHGVPHVVWRDADGWRLEEGMPHVHRGQSLRLKAFDAWLARGAPAATYAEAPLPPGG
jgi:glutathione synthase/RimK-type ligase-like ATP-grasp enzyme